jgi:hypothetical protein
VVRTSAVMAVPVGRVAFAIAEFQRVGLAPAAPAPAAPVRFVAECCQGMVQADSALAARRTQRSTTRNTKSEQQSH